jgi:hypothetical protein
MTISLYQISIRQKATFNHNKVIERKMIYNFNNVDEVIFKIKLDHFETLHGMVLYFYFKQKYKLAF